MSEVARTLTVDFVCASVSEEMEDAMVDACIKVMKKHGAHFEGAGAGPTQVPVKERVKPRSWR